MKPSVYNLFISQGNGDYIVYNTLSDAILRIDKAAKESFQAGRIEEIERNALQTMTECGVVIDNNVDEWRICSYNFQSKKFSSRIARFLVLTTYDCNLSCPYCYQKPIVQSRKSMDRKTTDNLVKFIQKFFDERRYSRLILGLYGGEPLLNLNCCYRICDQLRSWTKKKGIRFDVILTTNAILLSDTVLDRLSPLFSVHVTLDGPREIHNRKRSLKGRIGTYDRIMQILGRLVEREIKTTIRINIAKDNLPLLPSLLQDLQNRGILNCRHIRVYTQVLGQPWTNGVIDKDTPYLPENESGKTGLYLWHLGKQWGFDAGDSGVEPCSFVNDWTFAVDPYGDIYKCPMWIGRQQYRVGTLLDEGTIDLEPTFYDQMTFDPCKCGKCRDCSYLPKCGGGCPKDGIRLTNVSDSGHCEIIDDIEKTLLFDIHRRIEVKS